MTIRLTIPSPQAEPSESSRNFLCLAAGLVTTCLCVLPLFTAGCASTNGRHYTYHTLPPELLAVKRDNPQTLDLIRLAKPSSNSTSIEHGDVLDVSLFAGLDEKATVKVPVRVNDQGYVTLPEIGPVLVAGLEPQAAEAVITRACIDGEIYRNPAITVEMKQQRMNLVTVVGTVMKPDVYELPRGKSDLLSAIVAAGGLDEDAGTHVEIRNPQRNSNSRSRSTPIASGVAPGLMPGVDAAGFSNDAGDGSPMGGDGTSAGPVSSRSDSLEAVHVDLVSVSKANSNEFQVDDGGVVSVERRDPQPLHVIGLVKKSDSYKFPYSDDLRVTDAIALAGGISNPLADKIFVIRRIPKSSETAVIQVSLREAKRNALANVRLEPGDVVSVEQTPASAVYETLNIIRFNAGMSIPAAGIF